jgi:hypothetical protein
MNFQSALENLAKVFIVFYISCAMVGRLDLPMKLIIALQSQSLAGISSNWECPSINKKACHEYDPNTYKNK